MNHENHDHHHVPWNKGKLIGQKSPLKLKEIWAIRIRLQMAQNTRELALFNLAIDSKLRGCDLVKLKVYDVAQNGRVLLIGVEFFPVIGKLVILKSPFITDV
ncbi:MAG: hypothetical protein ACR65R_04460 [Methylomicrobium sp.]